MIKRIKKKREWEVEVRAVSRYKVNSDLQSQVIFFFKTEAQDMRSKSFKMENKISSVKPIRTTTHGWRSLAC